MRGVVYCGEPIERAKNIGADDMAGTATKGLAATITGRVPVMLQYYFPGMLLLSDGSRGKRRQAVHRYLHLDEAATADETFDLRITSGSASFLM